VRYGYSIPAILILLFPLALAASPPLPPTLVWGDINAPCALTAISPGISVVAEANSTQLSSLSLVADGNFYRFGGPLAGDPKLVIPADYPDANIVLHYPDATSDFLLGSLQSDTQVHYVEYNLSETNCESLYPAAEYSITVSLPDDCNGSVQGMVFRMYYNGKEVYSITLSGSRSTSFIIHVDGLKYGVPQGSEVSARIYLNSTYTTWYNHFYYGKHIDWSIDLPCDTYFPSSQQTEQNTETATASGGGAGGTPESNSVTTVSTPPKTIPTTLPQSSSSIPKTAIKRAASPSSATEENVNVPVGASPQNQGIFGVPLDQAVVVALVVIIAIIVVVRFFI